MYALGALPHRICAPCVAQAELPSRVQNKDMRAFLGLVSRMARRGARMSRGRQSRTSNRSSTNFGPSAREPLGARACVSHRCSGAILAQDGVAPTRPFAAFGWPRKPRLRASGNPTGDRDKPFGGPHVGLSVDPQTLLSGSSGATRTNSTASGAAKVWVCTCHLWTKAGQFDVVEQEEEG